MASSGQSVFGYLAALGLITAKPREILVEENLVSVWSEYASLLPKKSSR